MIIFMKRIEDIVYKIFMGLASCCIAVLLLLLTAQILSRHLRINALAPPDEIITLLFAWMVFVGAALLVRNNFHLRVELVDLFLQKHPSLQVLYNSIVSLVILFFLFVMTSSGIKLFINSGTRTSPMLQLPQRLWYVVLPLSGILMILYTIVRFVNNATALSRRSEGTEVINNKFKKGGDKLS